MIYCVIGHNGNYRDPASGAIPLGNGYRSYRTGLMRFICPDSWSPFGAGGINPYTYCAGDPVNRADPSGHFSRGQWIGMGLGLVAGIALGIVTEGAAMPFVLTLIATVTGDAMIGAGAELITETVDNKEINRREVFMAAGISAAASLLGYRVAMASRLKSIGNRPFGGLMLEGEEATAGPNLNDLSNEIIESVMKNLDRQSLTNLSLTSRRMYTLAQKPMAGIFERELTNTVKQHRYLGALHPLQGMAKSFVREWRRFPNKGKTMKGIFRKVAQEQIGLNMRLYAAGNGMRKRFFSYDENYGLLMKDILTNNEGTASMGEIIYYIDPSMLNQETPAFGYRTIPYE